MMTPLDELFSLPQYSIGYEKKVSLLLAELNSLTRFHYQKSPNYKRILDNLGYSTAIKTDNINSLPYLPVRIFKTRDLKSIDDDEVLKILTSSGTTGQQVSRIALNKETSLLQVKALAAIITSYLGNRRLPMIIIDTEKTIKNKSSLSARGAGLVGLSNFGRSHFFALDENMKLKTGELLEYVEKYKDENILIFGFTYMIWEYFLGAVKNSGKKIDLSRGTLIHSGGWKKLIEQSVSNEVFKSELNITFGLEKIFNFYGMVEQVGSIFMECEHGFLHTPNFAEIIIRDFNDWSAAAPGTSGIIQTLSVLPRSYPGHSLLTEDLGTVIGIDDCRCGRKGTYFKIEGRIPKAELRGCSDTHAESVMNPGKDKTV